MKVKYFEDTDTALVEFSSAAVAETQEISESVYADLDASGNLVSMTIEHAKAGANRIDTSTRKPTMTTTRSDHRLDLILDGAPVPLDPPARLEDGDAWVPLHSFCTAAGAVVKELEDRHAVCRAEGSDVCVLLDAADVKSVNGTRFGRLEAFVPALGLSWSLREGDLVVQRADEPAAVVAVGQPAPPIELPDIDTGQLVSWEAYRERPAVFYMWASW